MVFLYLVVTKNLENIDEWPDPPMKVNNKIRDHRVVKTVKKFHVKHVISKLRTNEENKIIVKQFPSVLQY